ncbi:MAG TPA: copper amine oxidase N-terminal domain-containing protein [Bacillota bacterium]|nr:copper amine oxidase N-terminal domain-containing protein [Bacillota bacterium]
MKRLTALVSLVLLLLSSSSASAEKSPTIKLGTMQLAINHPVLIVNNRVLVPLRNLFEAQGVTVSWNGKTQGITAKRGSEQIYLTLGSKLASHNGKSIKLDSAPKSYNGVTYVPVRFAAESLGARVSWDNRSRTVTIQDNKVANWLKKLSGVGKSGYWKIADINKDGRPEIVALIFTEKGRRLVIFNETRQLFSKAITWQVNELAFVTLENKAMGLAVYQVSSGRIKNAIIYTLVPQIAELRRFSGSKLYQPANSGGTGSTGTTGTTGGAGGGSSGGSTGTVGTGGTGAGSSGGAGTSGGIALKPVNPANINSVSQAVFYDLLSGDLEKAKALTVKPNDPATEAFLKKCTSDITSFINKHNGIPWTTSTGTSVIGNTTQYFNWIKYPTDSGYLVINLQIANDKWLISRAEFKIGD